MLAATIAATGWTNPTLAAGGIDAARLGAALTRPVDVALSIDVSTPFPLAFALLVLRMLLQVPLELIL
jgi:hypothetical protein